MISLVVGILLLSMGLYLFLSGVWQAVSYLICALMLNDARKPNEFNFRVGFSIVNMPVILWTAGTLVLVLR